MHSLQSTAAVVAGYSNQTGLPGSLPRSHWHETDMAGLVSDVWSRGLDGSWISRPSGQLL